MSKIFKSKKRIIAIVVVVLILVAIFVNAFYKEDDEDPSFDIAKIETKTLTTSISATGKIVSETSKNITSQLVNYKVNKVNVKVGDKVNVGDVLCTFDTTDLAKTVSDLQASIDAGTISGNATVTGAEASLQSSQIQSDMQLDSLNEQVQTAWQEYQNHNTPLENSKAELAKKQSEASALQAQLDSAVAQGNQTLIDQINSQLVPKNAEVAEIQAIVTQQEAEVKIYKDAYDTLQDQYNKQQQIASASIAGVQSQVDSAKAQTSVATLTYEQQLSAYKKQLAETNLKATEAGTVTAVNIKEGDYYTGGTLLTVEGVESFLVETEIDEYDIADITTGMEVIIKTDATRDEELAGEVTSVAPAATGSSSSSSSTAMSMMTGVGSATTSTSATYTVKVALKTQNERLRLGMNAKLNIITKKSENVLSVPYAAVTEKDDGTKTITLIKDDNSEEEITVTTGLESGYYTEISSDKIKEGMKVKIPKVDSTSTVDEILNSMGATAGM